MSEAVPQSEPRAKREVKIPKIECKKTQCDRNLHSFLDGPKKKKAKQELSSPVPHSEAYDLAAIQESINSDTPGKRRCWNCGADLVDWDRTHARDIADIDYTIQALQFEHVRHEFWCKEIDPWAVDQAKRRGRARMPQCAAKRIWTSVGKAKNYNEGRQTKGHEDVLFYAQHATATCCRRCMNVWHGIPEGRELFEEEVNFCVELLVRYVDARLPDLNKEPQYVPSRPGRKEAFAKVADEKPVAVDVHTASRVVQLSLEASIDGWDGGSP
jgi:hypothetical protein